MFECLRGSDAVVGVIDEELLNEINYLGAGLRDELSDASAFDAPHAELSEVHVARMPLELVQQLLVRRTENVMDLVHLVQLVVPREEWK